MLYHDGIGHHSFNTRYCTIILGYWIHHLRIHLFEAKILLEIILKSKKEKNEC